jgi:hypothetical protein
MAASPTEPVSAEVDSRWRERANPFYVAVVIVGVAFVLTSCCYAILAARDLGGQAGMDSHSMPAAGGQWFLQQVDRYGFRALMIELALLAVATFAAMITDGRRDAGAVGRAAAPGGSQLTMRPGGDSPRERR